MSRMTIELGPDQAAWLENKAVQTGETKTRVIRQALAVMQLEEAEQKHGNTLAIVCGDRVVKEIVRA